MKQLRVRMPKSQEGLVEAQKKNERVRTALSQTRSFEMTIRCGWRVAEVRDDGLGRGEEKGFGLFAHREGSFVTCGTRRKENRIGELEESR
jgi:hypothetical protein